MTVFILFKQFNFTAARRNFTGGRRIKGPRRFLGPRQLDALTRPGIPWWWFRWNYTSCHKYDLLGRWGTARFLLRSRSTCRRLRLSCTLIPLLRSLANFLLGRKALRSRARLPALFRFARRLMLHSHRDGLSSTVLAFAARLVSCFGSRRSGLKSGLSGYLSKGAITASLCAREKRS